MECRLHGSRILPSDGLIYALKFLRTYHGFLFGIKVGPRKTHLSNTAVDSQRKRAKVVKRKWTRRSCKSCALRDWETRPRQLALSLEPVPSPAPRARDPSRAKQLTGSNILVDSSPYHPYLKEFCYVTSWPIVDWAKTTFISDVEMCHSVSAIPDPVQASSSNACQKPSTGIIVLQLQSEKVGLVEISGVRNLQHLQELHMWSICYQVIICFHTMYNYTYMYNHIIT